MRQVWTATALLGLGGLGLSGCYVVSPYPYGYPAYGPPPPATVAPAPPRAASPPPPASGGGGTPGATPAPPPPGQAAPPAGQANCQDVTVEGYYRTHVTASGERVTVWVPAHTERVCR
jgi:hypothetical protein